MEEKVVVKVVEVDGLPEAEVKEVVDGLLVVEEGKEAEEDGLQEEVEDGRQEEVEDGQVVVEVAAVGMMVEQRKIGGERYLFIEILFLFAFFINKLLI